MKKKNKINVDKIKVSFLMFIFVIGLFITFIARITYLCTANYKVGDSTITAFIKNRNTKEEIILPKRGSILDTNNNILAEDVASYSVIAYLSESRSENSTTPKHVVDPVALILIWMKQC